MSSSRRAMDLLVRDLLKSGFIVERTGSGHWKVRPPEGGGWVIMAFSPRRNSFHKTLGRLKNLGYTPRG